MDASATRDTKTHGTSIVVKNGPLLTLRDLFVCFSFLLPLFVVLCFILFLLFLLFLSAAAKKVEPGFLFFCLFVFLCWLLHFRGPCTISEALFGHALSH